MKSPDALLGQAQELRERGWLDKDLYEGIAALDTDLPALEYAGSFLDWIRRQHERNDQRRAT